MIKKQQTNNKPKHTKEPTKQTEGTPGAQTEMKLLSDSELEAIAGGDICIPTQIR